MACTHPSHACKSLGTSSSTQASCCRDVAEGNATYQSSHSNTTMGESKWTWGAKLQAPLQNLLTHQGKVHEAAGRRKD